MNTVESSSAEALFGISGSGTLNTPISHRTQGPPLATSSPSYGRTAATSTSTTAYLSFLLLTHLLHLWFLFCFVFSFSFFLFFFSFPIPSVSLFLTATFDSFLAVFSPIDRGSLACQFADWLAWSWTTISCSPSLSVWFSRHSFIARRHSRFTIWTLLLSRK